MRDIISMGSQIMQMSRITLYREKRGKVYIMAIKEVKIMNAGGRELTGAARRIASGDVTGDYYATDYDYMFLFDVVNLLMHSGAVTRDSKVLQMVESLNSYLGQKIDVPSSVERDVSGDSVVITFFE